MSIHLDTTCHVAKTFAVKREKQADDSEVVMASLKLSEVFVDREQLDELLGQPIGWSTESLFDELGAPRAHVTLTVHRMEWQASGVIRGGQKTTDPRLTLKDAEITALDLTKLGATLSCTLGWVADGDEVNDVADMLGQTCGAKLVLTDDGQGDLLAPLRNLAKQDGITSVEVEIDGQTIAKFDVKQGETVSSASEAMKLLDKGWTLVTEAIDGHDPRLESPDGKTHRKIWLNAAKSCIKRGLDCEGDNVEGFRYTSPRAA